MNISNKFKIIIKQFPIFTLNYLIILILVLVIMGICHHKIPKHLVSAKFDKIESQLKTGDLILFSHYDYLGSIIKFWSGDYFYHSAIVIRINNKTFLLESDAQGLFDIVSGTYKDGPHITRFDKSMRKLYGKSYALWCPIKKELNPEKVFNIVSTKYKNSSFTLNPFIWYLAKAKFNAYNYIPKTDDYFCSELVADIYQEFGIINKDIPSNLYTFKDLRNLNIFKKNIYCIL